MVVISSGWVIVVFLMVVLLEVVLWVIRLIFVIVESYVRWLEKVVFDI